MPESAKRPVAVPFDEIDRDRLLAALKASRSGTWRWNVPENIVEWDEALCGVYGIDPSNAPRTAEAFLDLIHPDDRERAWKAISDCLTTGRDADYQFRVIVGDSIRWVYDRSAVIRNPDGSPAYMLGACLDVTDRRRVQEERDAALARQKVLLSELSHRVKNHLGMIVAMLRLKSGRQRDPVAKQDFDRAIDRVNTIAYLHDRLYLSGDVRKVEVKEYLSDICDNLERSILAEKNISIARELEPFEMHVDQAVPIGLIVSELVTNSAKYAFPEGAPGRILVRFRIRGDRGTLTISDNGRGMPAEIEAGVGSRLIKSLARQVGARMRMVTTNGVTCSLSFRAQPTDE